MKSVSKRIGRKGSVMMEFIVVFPIYLVLFGAVFAIGDMLIHSNRLASGDRVNAFNVDGWAAGAWSFFTASVFDTAQEVDDRRQAQDWLERLQDGWTGRIYADATGPWTVCAGSCIRDRYRLPAGGTLGQLLSADRFFNTSLTGPADLRSRNQMLQDWEQDRPVYLRSKGGNLINLSDSRSYSFYVLKRRVGASWRDYTSGLLPNERWRTEVANEAWHDAASIAAGRSSCSPMDNISNLEDYHRYPQFVAWSE